MQTPSRPLPGAFINTPANNRFQSSSAPPPPVFRTTSTTSTSTLQAGLSRERSWRELNQEQAQQRWPAPRQPGSQSQEQVQTGLPTSQQTTIVLQPLERAARTINETLMQELRFPELDNCVGQGISSNYDLPTSAAWAPFVKAKTYEVPDKVFAQYNRAQVSTAWGLFAGLNHTWVTIDNAMYIWDYTNPSPNLLGFEDQPYTITNVCLVVPRPGVFIAAITHLVVVATTAELALIALQVTSDPSGHKTIEMWQTGITISVKGMDVGVIASSAATGRVFFSSKTDNDVYELTYQQEEKWFQNRCSKINHTSTGFGSLTPNFLALSSSKSSEHILQMVIDDSRSMLYTLSSTSAIRLFQMRSNNGLDLAATQTISATLSSVAHTLSSSNELLAPGVRIISIQPISSKEANKLHLMATTSTGCRLFFSVTSSYGYVGGAGLGRLSMQVQHIRFPPPPPGGVQPTTPKSTAQSNPPQSQLSQYRSAQLSADTQSKSLLGTRKAYRFAPGYFVCCASTGGQGATDHIFVAAPDSGRIVRSVEPNQPVGNRYLEHCNWFNVGDQVQDVGLASPPFAAASVPLGFGNELAVQFDEPIQDIAILTNTGVHIFRRRRLVDIFAAVIKTSSGSEGLDAQMKQFISRYGRGEITATALAVACGQGTDISPDERVSKIPDTVVLDNARKAFIEHAGKPVFNENMVVDQSTPAMDNVLPSPRHEGIALYISRLVRSIWMAPVLREAVTPKGGLSVTPSVSLIKLRNIQDDMTKLQTFLNKNRSFIEGLAGPESLATASNRHEEVALQAEHRALHSLTVIIASIIEGISFVLVLFEEKVEDIVLSLPATTRQLIRQLTFEGLFASSGGKALAKDLVQAIVNRNIASGSNVETVAEALRRRCGSFCSADDVVVFKAQEQLKKAAGVGATTESGRRLLHESLRLFKKVAGALLIENLQSTVEQYINMQYYAGGIELSLCVAKETDRGNKALRWVREGKPQDDDREALYRSRMRIYELVHLIIVNVDAMTRQAPDILEGSSTIAAKRKAEAYQVVDDSDDEVFQYDLYDWYLTQGWEDRLLNVQSSFVVSYLQDKAVTNASHADLLWQYYSLSQRYFDAADVQLHLATSDFPIPLEKRIEYLSKAKANASTTTPGVSRQGRQVLLHDISEQLDVANIQDDLLARLMADERLRPEKKQEVIEHLNGKIIGLSDLHNEYADQAGYFDICLIIFQTADFRGAANVKSTWQHLIDQTHDKTVAKREAQPYEIVADQVRSLGIRLNLSESTFPVPVLLPMLEIYALEKQRSVAPPSWVIDTFLSVAVPYETLLPVLDSLFQNEEPPFTGQNLRIIANDIVYVVERWLQEGMRGAGNAVLGGEANATAVAQLLLSVGNSPAGESKRERIRELRVRVERILR